MKKLKPKERERYVEENTALIGFVIKKYFSWTGVHNEKENFFLLEYNDLFHEGMLGLIEAAKRYDKSKDNDFPTFATFYVRLFIQKGIARCGTRILKFPKRIHELRADINKICSEENKTYLDLYKEARISLEQYFALNIFKGLNRYVSVYDVIRINELAVNDENLISVFSKEDKGYCKKLVWKLAKGCFKKDLKRNYYIVCLRIGFDTDQVLSFKKIASLVAKRSFKNNRMTPKKVRKVMKVFISHSKEVLLKTDIFKGNRIVSNNLV